MKITKNQATEFCTIIHSSSFPIIILPCPHFFSPLNLNAAPFPQDTAEQAGSDNRIYKNSHKKQKFQRKQQRREPGEAAYPPQLHPHLGGVQPVDRRHKHYRPPSP